MLWYIPSIIFKVKMDRISDFNYQGNNAKAHSFLSTNSLTVEIYCAFKHT